MVRRRAAHILLVSALVCAGALSCTEQLDLGTQNAETDGTPPSNDLDGAADQGGFAGSGDGSGGAMGTGRGGASGSGGLACENTLFEMQSEPGRPFAFVVLQRSSSMLEKVGDRTKLALVGHVLEKAFVDRRLPVGLVQFPGYTPLCDADLACCSTDILLTPKADAGRAIERLVLCQDQPQACFQTSSSVPTAAALQRVRFFIKGLNATGRQAILLFTDSDPACGGQSVCEQTIAETAGLFQEDVETFVLPLGEKAAEAACLPRIARAGDTLAVDASLNALTSEGALHAAVGTALASIEKGFCQLALRFAPRRPDQLRVFIDGLEVSRAGMKQATSTFAFIKGSSTRIEIAGAACETLKRRAADVRVFQACCVSDRECRP